MGRLQKVVSWIWKWFEKKPKEDDCQTAVLEDDSAPIDVCHTGRSPPVVAATDASSPDDVTGPASSSDDVTVPALFPILLASSFHMREIVFSQCSVLELTRLSCASKAAREMSLAAMGRRKLDINVGMAQYFSDEHSVDRGLLCAERGLPCAEKVKLTIADRYGPDLDLVQTIDLHDWHYNPRINPKDDQMTILYTPAVYSRVRSLDIEKVESCKCFWLSNLLKSGLLMKNKPPLYVEILSVPFCPDTMDLLDYVSAERVILKDYNDPYHESISYDLKATSSRALLGAKFLEIDNVQPFDELFPLLMPPNIYLRERVPIPDDCLHIFIKQWQSGVRTVESFCGGVVVRDTYCGKSYEGYNYDQPFNKRLGTAICHFSENPYPSDDVIPSSIRLQLETIEKYHGTVDKVPRSFVIGRDRDDSCLVVLERALKGKTVAVGIFQK